MKGHGVVVGAMGTGGGQPWGLEMERTLGGDKGHEVAPNHRDEGQRGQKWGRGDTEGTPKYGVPEATPPRGDTWCHRPR